MRINHLHNESQRTLALELSAHLETSSTVRPGWLRFLLALQSWVLKPAADTAFHTYHLAVCDESPLYSWFEKGSKISVWSGIGNPANHYFGF